VVEVAITDAAGRVSPLANHLVQFSVSGPGTIIGTGNGNPLSHENDKIPKRKAYHGLCQVLVQSTGEAGEIILTATSEGLQAAHLSMQTTDVGEIPHVPSLHVKTVEEQRTKYDADNGI
jgi:beta-galactosidase